MKKLLDSDWLRAVQFKCNTSAKSVTPVQIKPGSHLRHNDITERSRKPKKPHVECFMSLV